MLQEELDKIIDTTRRCMRLMGVWPDSQTKNTSSLRFFFCFFFITFFLLIPQTTQLYFVGNSLSDVIEVLTYADLATFAACCKLFTGWLNMPGRTVHTFYIFLQTNI